MPADAARYLTAVKPDVRRLVPLRAKGAHCEPDSGARGGAGKQGKQGLQVGGNDVRFFWEGGVPVEDYAEGGVVYVEVLELPRAHLQVHGC